MRLHIVCIWSLLLFLVCTVYAKGGPILIKSDGKKKNGKELIMLNGCSPMLIRGSDKKNKHQQMIIAGGGDCGEKQHVKYVPTYVPVPYYVHKPHYIHVPKYIHKHHYIRVPHVIVKKVPVPVHIPQYVPVPYEKKEIHLMYDKHHYHHGSHKYR